MTIAPGVDPYPILARELYEDDPADKPAWEDISDQERDVWVAYAKEGREPSGRNGTLSWL